MNAHSISWRSCFVLGLAVAVVSVAAPAYSQQPDVATLVRAATSGRATDRYVAIDDLGERHEAPATVLPVLQQLLADADPQVRWRSARALGDYGLLAKGAAPTLRSLLRDQDPIVQYHAAATLGKIGDKSDETVRALVEAVGSPDSRVARTAIAALRNLQPEPAFVAEAFDKMLASDDSVVSLFALEALVERGADAVPILNEALKRPRTALLACAAIEQIGPPASATVPALAELLGKTTHSQLLIHALLALASIGPAANSATPQIVPLLSYQTDATVPAAAAFALGSIGPSSADADDKLRQGQASDNAFLQMMATWALARLHPEDQAGIKRAVDKLIQGLTSDDAGMSTAAAKCLQLLQAPPEMVAPAMAAAAKTADPHATTNIVNAIAGLGESVVPRATAALANPELRGLAVRVLTQLGPKAKDAVSPLVEASAAADPEFRAQIHFALAAIGPDAAPATAKLAEAIGHSDERVRHSALYALRQIGPGAMGAKQALLARAAADDSFDALAAAWALTSIAPRDTEVAGRVVPKLTIGLANADQLVRLESVEALGVWGRAAASAVDALRRLAADDPSSAVRSAAQTALSQIAP